jgi:hypothetical protein
MSACHQAKTFVTNFGLSALLEYEWTRLNVPNVLRAFWILRIIGENLFKREDFSCV